MKIQKAARGRVLITPAVGTPMAGNIRLDNQSRGVHDDLYCNILILNDSHTKVCLLGFDLIGLEYVTCSDIKARIEKATDISAVQHRNVGYAYSFGPRYGDADVPGDRGFD